MYNEQECPLLGVEHDEEDLEEKVGLVQAQNPRTAQYDKLCQDFENNQPEKQKVWCFSSPKGDSPPVTLTLKMYKLCICIIHPTRHYEDLHVNGTLTVTFLKTVQDLSERDHLECSYLVSLDWETSLFMLAKVGLKLHSVAQNSNQFSWKN